MPSTSPFLLLLCLLCTGAHAAPQRVVSLGGTLTEIVFALGAGGRLVGTDSSSLYPDAARRLPHVGYYRAFSVEGVLSLRPDLVLVSDQAGTPAAIAQLQHLGVRLRVLPSRPDFTALEERVRGVADALERHAAGEALLERIRRRLAPLPRPPRPVATLLLVYHGGRLQGAGRATEADAILKLAGAGNVLAARQGYAALSPEAIVALAPHAIVTTRLSLENAGGLEPFLARAGIAATPAGRARRIVVMDDLLLLGFGPRVAEAAAQLQSGLAGASTH